MCSRAGLKLYGWTATAHQAPAKTVTDAILLLHMWYIKWRLDGGDKSRPGHNSDYNYNQEKN